MNNPTLYLLLTNIWAAAAVALSQLSQSTASWCFASIMAGANLLLAFLSSRKQRHDP
jgi:hypothetical protein